MQGLFSFLLCPRAQSHTWPMVLGRHIFVLTDSKSMDLKNIKSRWKKMISLLGEVLRAASGRDCISTLASMMIRVRQDEGDHRVQCHAARY